MTVRPALGAYAIPPGPMVSGFAVTTSDTVVFANPTRGLWIGSAGAVSVFFNADTVPVTLTGVPAGTLLEVSVVQVRATGTTASNIVALS